MNIQQLRTSLKEKWLIYYQQNRSWMVGLRIWGTYDGQRRPSSSFILATLSILEPQLPQMLPFIVDLSNNPDNIVAALGLNFNPDTELTSLVSANAVVSTQVNSNGKLVANGVPATQGKGNAKSVKTPQTVANEVRQSPSSHATNLPSWVDESCEGVGCERSKSKPKQVGTQQSCTPKISEVPRPIKKVANEADPVRVTATR